MVTRPTFGNNLSIDKLNSLDDYAVFTMEEPWKIINEKINTMPRILNFNREMSLENLNKIYKDLISKRINGCTLIGLGGGTACDTAKFMAWKLKEEKISSCPLILIPSIISVDAFLCSSIAVRIADKVKYVGESAPKEILIDYDLIKSAPNYLNRAGVSDTISITSALGDWIIARNEINEKFDQGVFTNAKRIVEDLMKAKEDIHAVSNDGIKALVDGFYREVELTKKWGNARPEEGSEHFLAYCLESITHEHYIHGNIIGLNILISLILQEERAVFPLELIQQFFKDIELSISPEKQNISLDQLENALKMIKRYVESEGLFYSIYNSPQLILNEDKINIILDFVKKL